MLRSISVFGQMDGFREFLEERLERAGAELVDINKHADFKICIGINENCDLSLDSHGSENTLSNVAIGIEDVIIPSGARDWGNGKILDWIDCIKKGHDPITEDRIRYWVNIRDVVEAITTISMFEGEIGLYDQVKICGRRGWKDEHVIDEIRVLWERYSNSINYSHTIESLSSIPSPVRGIGSEESSLTGLDSIHDILITCGGNGWQPLVPLRISLMEMIASVETLS